MPNFNADEVVKQSHIRTFIQFGQARPNNKQSYGGQDAQYMSIDGVTVPELGGVDPIWVPDPRHSGKYKLVGRKYSPPDLSKASLKLLEKHGAIPRQLVKGCGFNLYENVGACKDLSDFLGGWSDYVLVYSGAVVTDKDLGTRTSWDADDQTEDSLSLILSAIYPVGALGFGEQAAAQVDREVVDVVYGTSAQCGDCGPADDGTQRIYSVTKSSGAGSPGMPGEVQYSLNGGLTWAEATITGIGATADPTYIDIVGDKLVVGVSSENAYYWATLSAIGVPGTFTKVTAGFVASRAANDIYVVSAREVYFAGDGGYVYRSDDVTSGVTVVNAGAATTNNLSRIHGSGETIVAVGASSTLIYSRNRGTTFTTATVAPSLISTTLQALWVLDARRWWVGTALGRVVYTLNAGESWTEKTFSGSGAGNVWDIVFATEEVGYIAHATATPTGRIFSTWDGGYSWTLSQPRILNFPTITKAGRIAVPTSSNEGVDANNLAIAGLSGGGTDGVVLVGAATML